MEGKGWLAKRDALTRYQVGWRRLEDWRTKGLVRSVKLDPSRTGRRLYSCADLDKVLDRMAAGRAK